ncbi:MAG TPA: carboxypeptidase regulatory-like domain-containing protein, partial [Opitutus sp.]|nr:carboxypeptidase regulatory-like domain-containing protein [Opitutus sp.]
MKRVFHYAEAKTCLPRPGLEELMKALRTSLDAGLPANLDIFTETGIGHSLVVDGYGYTGGTRFHHLNLGWGGHSDAWYNFPPIDVVLGDGTPEFFTIITALKYNIDPEVAGEMITGRIVDANGKPVGGATVQLNTSPARSVTTNARGLYAFKGLASNTSYKVSAAAPGYLIDSAQATVTTGNAAAETETTPNRIVDFNASPLSAAVSAPNGLNPGASVLLSVPANAAQPTGWRRNGVPLAGTASLSHAISNLQPADAGLYALSMSRGSETIESALALIGIESSAKVAGAGREVLSNIFLTQVGNTFDQVLLEGTAASVTADHVDRQITRISYIDLDDDIVQVEFSGPGTLTLTLAGASGPARPLNYAQDVQYMKGHASIVITGATRDSHVSIFSVGKANAANQALFKPAARYDGLADVAFLAIASRDGKFGGVRAANANFFAAQGVTGVYAPGVEVTGPLYLGNITAFDAARPMILVGSAADVRITGGDLYQDNGRAVQVSGLASVAFRDGSDSHGNLLPAKANRGALQENGSDLTSSLVRSAPPAGGER